MSDHELRSSVPERVVAVPVDALGTPHLRRRAEQSLQPTRRQRIAPDGFAAATASILPVAALAARVCAVTTAAAAAAAAAAATAIAIEL